MGGNPGDKAGNITDVIYPDGSKETTEYDILGRTIKVTPRTGLTTEYTYDMLGNVTSVRQGEQVTRYEYDLMGRQTMTISADGSETTYAYDALGNLITETDPLGNSTAFAYTAESLLERVTYANGSQQSLTYDLVGNIVSETDAEGYTKRYHYDAVNRLIGVTDELGHKTSYTYDPTDNIAQVRDALGHITAYTYDTNGNLTSETDALGNTVRYQYTPEGWLEKVIKADGKEFTFEYDKTGNLLSQHAGDQYTISSEYNELGQITRVSSETGTIEYQYDDRGYLISVKNVNGETVSYTYDQYGNKESMTYPDGRTVWYTYDAMNRLINVTDLDGEITRYTYDAAGRRIKTENSTLTTAYEYDKVGNLIRQKTDGLSRIAFSYSHNKNGYITGEVREENGETTESQYGYDALGQLVSFKQSTGYGEQYAYDATGNMTKKVISPEQSVGQKKNQTVTIKMKYNPGNQLTEMAVGKDKISYSYDPNGSMVRKVLASQKYGTLTDEYTYDVLDQFTGYYGYDGYTQILTYDANGMRLSKKEKGNTNRSTLEELLRGSIEGLPEIVEPETTEEGYEWATTEYLYDITQEYYQVIRETTANGSESISTEYAYGTERLAGYGDDEKTTYVYDGRGSVAQSVTAVIAWKVTNPQDETREKSIQSYQYTPFGEQQYIKTSGFTYNAEAFDASTGMQNLRARQYELTISKFNQKDILRGEIIYPLSLNRYGYCINCPEMFVDPSGREDESPLYNFKKMNDSMKKKVIELGDMVLGSDPALNPVHDYLVAYSSQLNETSVEILNDAIEEMKRIDENKDSMAIKRRKKNAIQWETCYAIRESENGIPKFDDYFEQGTAENTINYWNAVMDYSENPLPGDKVYQIDLVEYGTYVGFNGFVNKNKDNYNIENCLNGKCGHLTHNTQYTYYEQAERGKMINGRYVMSCNGQYVYTYDYAGVYADSMNPQNPNNEASTISSTQSAFLNSVKGTQYFTYQIDKKCLIPGTPVYTYPEIADKNNKKEVTTLAKVMNGEVKLDKSRPGHMMMLIINGILIDPSGSDKYGKNGIGTTNIQEKGHVIGWPDGVVLYDKKYSTIK